MIPVELQKLSVFTVTNADFFILDVDFFDVAIPKHLRNSSLSNVIYHIKQLG